MHLTQTMYCQSLFTRQDFSLLSCVTLHHASPHSSRSECHCLAWTRGKGVKRHFLTLKERLLPPLQSSSKVVLSKCRWEQNRRGHMSYSLIRLHAVSTSWALIPCSKELTPNIDSFHFPKGDRVSVVHSSSCVNNHMDSPHGSKEQIVVSDVSFHHCYMCGSWKKCLTPDVEIIIQNT